MKKDIIDGIANSIAERVPMALVNHGFDEAVYAQVVSETIRQEPSLRMAIKYFLAYHRTRA